MRVATKYPRIAARHLEETGRQGEIVEVKGSVELAPLTGMVDAIVDLTATGTTLRENNLVVREEIVVCTARLIANPVAHKLKAAQIDALLERCAACPAASAVLRCACSASAIAELEGLGGAGRRRRAPARARRRRQLGASRPCARSSQRVRAEGDAAVLDYTRRFDATASRPLEPASARCWSPPSSSTRRSRRCRSTSSPACR